MPVAEAGTITPEDNYVIFSAVLLSTESKGNMTISSADVLDPPVISPNWLTSEADVEQAYAAFLRVREITGNWESVTQEVLPGPNITSKAEILPYLAKEGGLIYHGTSTCKSYSACCRHYYGRGRVIKGSNV